ncbi:hypothetical protein [Bradyrhizobium japonicum]|uniref:hypothetical protein n=1 Tax=Bradyrhizobium japonicum TaxID=375 RepID=UPI001E3EBE64|nr:hypothetical protein [Bradyrhizobium japonicum]MCD9817616.1 hypothetical protein [Bradyrhizobium japonicum]MEB2672541.1 hypothetical protein [Bradyrhizobium japonicum]WRI91802.1 hypothetical protein R3F75_13080 [Bradyrhizobium japonicum]
MFDIYVSNKGDLLVLSEGSAIPVLTSRKTWRKRRRARKVSDEIRSAVQKNGYYLRSLRDSNGKKG